MTDKGMVVGHKHTFPLTVATFAIVYGLLGYMNLDVRLNWIITGVVTYLVAGLWHDKMCKMG